MCMNSLCLQEASELKIGWGSMNNSVSTVSVQVILLPNKPTPNQSVTVPAYNVVGTRIPLTSLRPLTTPTDVTYIGESHHDESHILAYSFVTVGVLAFVAVIMFVVFCIHKRNKLDRIRHHLMPMYTFDPADDEARWEADLLEDDREQQIALNSVLAESRPKLKFHSHGLDT